MSSDKYVNVVIENIEKKLRSEGRHLPRRADTPMSSSYHPEEYMSVYDGLLSLGEMIS